jgi:hypothetical protein
VTERLALLLLADACALAKFTAAGSRFTFLPTEASVAVPSSRSSRIWKARPRLSP